MTDLEINVALAMGWIELSETDYTNMRKTGFRVVCDKVICAYNFCLLDFRFDYRNPVIFVAICKHWKLQVNHKYQFVGYENGESFRYSGFDIIEEAAALCVIDAVKRGVK